MSFLGICITGGGLAIFLGNVRAGRILHKSILRNIIASPMSFFDMTPVGRILNRFGKDLDVVDTLIAHNFSLWFLCTIQVISVPLVIGYSTPLFLTLVVPLVIIYYVVQVGKIILLLRGFCNLLLDFRLKILSFLNFEKTQSTISNDHLKYLHFSRFPITYSVTLFLDRLLMNGFFYSVYS